MSVGELSFCTPISNRYVDPRTGDIGEPLVGHCCSDFVEEYFSCCSSDVAVPVSDHEVRVIHATPTQCTITMVFIKTLVVLSYFTLIIPVVMLIAKAILRSGTSYSIVEGGLQAARLEGNRQVNQSATPGYWLNKWRAENSNETVHLELPRLSYDLQWAILKDFVLPRPIILLPQTREEALHSIPLIDKEIVLTALRSLWSQESYGNDVYLFSWNHKFCRMINDHFEMKNHLSEIKSVFRDLKDSFSFPDICKLVDQFLAILPEECPENELPALTDWIKTNNHRVTIQTYSQEGPQTMKWWAAEGKVFKKAVNNLEYPERITQRTYDFGFAREWLHPHAPLIALNNRDEIRHHPTMPPSVKEELIQWLDLLEATTPAIPQRLSAAQQQTVEDRVNRWLQLQDRRDLIQEAQNLSKVEQLQIVNFCLSKTADEYSQNPSLNYIVQTMQSLLVSNMDERITSLMQ